MELDPLMSDLKRPGIRVPASAPSSLFVLKADDFPEGLD